MHNPLLQMLGLCRRAQKLSIGHDACKDAVRQKKAQLCLLCADASPRLHAEFQSLCASYDVPVYEADWSMQALSHSIGTRAGVITIDDSGFAGSFTRTSKQITSAEVKDL